ncbi:unnamed protein product [Withania somnifera]
MATGSSETCYDLEITIVSAKHLKNVNWLHGDLKPYVIFWVDPDQRRATQSDDSGNTRPVWNERFVLHLPQSPHDTVVTFEIFHSKPSETPKPLVGTLRVPLKELTNIQDFNKLRTFELRRPSGRPQGKIRINYYYSTANPPPYRAYPPPPPAASPSPPPHSAHSYSYGGRYSSPYSSYYPGYYSQPPPRQSGYYGDLGSRPSAPFDYPPLQRGGTMGVGVGAVAGALGGLTLGEGSKYEEGKIAERVENSRASRDDYSVEY